VLAQHMLFSIGDYFSCEYSVGRENRLKMTKLKFLLWTPKTKYSSRGGWPWIMPLGLMWCSILFS
jgi:hypothetical protein